MKPLSGSFRGCEILKKKNHIDGKTLDLFLAILILKILLNCFENFTPMYLTLTRKKF